VKVQPSVLVASRMMMMKAITAVHITKMGDEVPPSRSSKCDNMSLHMLIRWAHVQFQCCISL